MTKINKYKRDLIHGYVMSDGYLRGGILTVDQGEKQKKFVEWLYKELGFLCTENGIKVLTRKRKPTKTNPSRETRSYRFFTRAQLHGFHNMWYKPYTDDEGRLRYRKVLPKTIDAFFSPTFVTLWFACDGTKVVGSRGAKFEVTCFTVEERLKLKKLFKTKFGIETSLIKQGRSSAGNQQWALQIPAAGYTAFRKIITQMDLIENVFPYKLHPKQ